MSHPIDPDDLKPDYRREQRDIEKRIDAKAAEKAETLAFFWRLRLILIETLLMGLLVLVLGLVIGHPAGKVFRAALLVSAGCLASGLLLLCLTDAASSGWKKLRARRWRR